MDNKSIKDNNTITVTFHNTSHWAATIRTNREVKKFEKKGFYLSDESSFIMDKDGFTSTLIFVKKDPWGSIEQKIKSFYNC